MASSSQLESALAEARSRRNIKFYNSVMTRLARFGELDEVERAFDDLRKVGLRPNEFSFSILLNCCTRSGAVDRYESVLQAMRDDGNVTINEVHYTTLIKGHVSVALNMDMAWQYFEQMERETPRIAPNIRTVNTMLRGCLYVGDLKGAKKLSKYIQTHGLAADRATRDTMVRAACTSFRAKKLKKALAEHAPNGPSTLSVAAQVDLCVAYALCGKHKRAAKVLELAQNGEQQQRDGKAAGNGGGGDKGDGDGDGGGGGAVDGALASSVQCVRAFLAQPAAQRDAIVRRFRVDAVRRFPPARPSSSSGQRNAAGTASSAPAPLEMASLFDAPSRPVKLEVGAGLGDWVVQRAEAEPDVNWIAIELRCDRACLIYAKAAMKGLTNLAVLAGDAHVIMRTALPSQSVHEVHVNFPQPPKWEQSEAHLVNTVFLDEAWRILHRGGAFIMTSDYEPYVVAVTQRLSKGDAETEGGGLASKWQPSFAAPPHYKTHEAGGLRGYKSVFNELWEARGFTRRFQAKYYTKRLRSSSGSGGGGKSDTATVQDADAPGSPDGKKKRKRKETSSQRRKRVKATAAAGGAVEEDEDVE